MYFYVGVMEGVMRQSGMHGVWTNKAEAKKAIEEWGMQEPDDYHHFVLVRFSVDAPGEEVVVSELHRICERIEGRKTRTLISQRWHDVPGVED